MTTPEKQTPRVDGGAQAQSKKHYRPNDASTWRGRVVVRRAVATVARCQACLKSFLRCDEDAHHIHCLECWCCINRITRIEAPRPPKLLADYPPRVLPDGRVEAWCFDVRERRAGK